MTLDGRIDLLPATREKPWVRPPISMDFQIPMHSSSGVQVAVKCFNALNSIFNNKLYFCSLDRCGS